MKLHVYRMYIRAFGPWLALLMLVFWAAEQTCRITTNTWLAAWSQAQGQAQDQAQVQALNNSLQGARLEGGG